MKYQTELLQGEDGKLIQFEKVETLIEKIKKDYPGFEVKIGGIGLAPFVSLEREGGGPSIIGHIETVY